MPMCLVFIFSAVYKYVDLSKTVQSEYVKENKQHACCIKTCLSIVSMCYMRSVSVHV